MKILAVLEHANELGYTLNSKFDFISICSLNLNWKHHGFFFEVQQISSLYLLLCILFPFLMCLGKMTRLNPPRWKDFIVNVFNYFLLTGPCVQLFTARMMPFQNGACWNFHLWESWARLQTAHQANTDQKILDAQPKYLSLRLDRAFSFFPCVFVKLRKGPANASC